MSDDDKFVMMIIAALAGPTLLITLAVTAWVKCKALLIAAELITAESPLLPIAGGLGLTLRGVLVIAALILLAGVMTVPRARSRGRIDRART